MKPSPRSSGATRPPSIRTCWQRSSGCMTPRSTSAPRFRRFAGGDEPQVAAFGSKSQSDADLSIRVALLCHGSSDLGALVRRPDGVLVLLTHLVSTAALPVGDHIVPLGQFGSAG